MSIKSLTCLIALCLLGACSSTDWSTRITLGPDGSMAVSGPTGAAKVENDGPGSVDVTAEDDDGEVRLDVNLKSKKDCRFTLGEDEKLKVHNSSDQPAFIRVTIDGD